MASTDAKDADDVTQNIADSHYKGKCVHVIAENVSQLLTLARGDILGSKLLQLGFDVNDVDQPLDDYNETLSALHYETGGASSTGTLRLLLSQGANAHAVSESENNHYYGATPLDLAVISGRKDVELLIDATTNINKSMANYRGSRTYLCIALQRHDFATAMQFLSAGADPNRADTTLPHGGAPLMCAITANAPSDVVFELVCRGADVAALHGGQPLAAHAMSVPTAALALAVGCPADELRPRIRAEVEVSHEFPQLKAQLEHDFERYRRDFATREQLFCYSHEGSSVFPLPVGYQSM